jgi:Holliday junction resolvase-like predicted endonuclease
MLSHTPPVKKSSRHSKITGDFGEELVLYWLSKHGFECARVDHTGIDLIARNPHTGDVMGISVKSRTRTVGTEGDQVNVGSKDLEKAKAACEAFGCSPYFAIVVDADGVVRVFITSAKRFQELIPPTPRGGTSWKMSASDLARYSGDSEIMAFELHAKTIRWWSVEVPP